MQIVAAKSINLKMCEKHAVYIYMKATAATANPSTCSSLDFEKKIQGKNNQLPRNFL